MKRFLTISLALFSMNQIAFAQKKKEPAQPRIIVIKGDEGVRAYGVNATTKSLRYKERKNAVNHKDVKLSQFSIYSYEPEEFTEAMLSYRSRDYGKARSQFQECAKRYKAFEEIPGNFSTLATFYEMECARKLDDLPALSSIMKKFISKPLVNKDHQLQLEVNEVFWEAVQKKSWDRLINVALDEKWAMRKLPGAIRAQIAYCTGLCYEATDQSLKALTAYNKAFTADFAASEIISKKAALSCFRIIKNHDETKLALKLYGTDDYNEGSQGDAFLKEAAALVGLWEKSLGGGDKLPADYLTFRKFKKGN